MVLGDCGRSYKVHHYARTSRKELQEGCLGVSSTLIGVIMDIWHKCIEGEDSDKFRSIPSENCVICQGEGEDFTTTAAFERSWKLRYTVRQEFYRMTLLLTSEYSKIVKGNPIMFETFETSKNLEEYGIHHQLELFVTYVVHAKLFRAFYNHTRIRDGKKYSLLVGEGNSAIGAKEDYAKKLSGKTLSVNTYQLSCRELEVPQLC